MEDTHRTVRKGGDGTQVAAPRILSVPLNDPAISHRSIDTRFRGLFNIFSFIKYSREYSRDSSHNGGAGASRPAFNKYFFIIGLVSFLYYVLDNVLSTPKARWINNSFELDSTD